MNNATTQQNRVFDPEKRDNALRGFIALLRRDKEAQETETHSEPSPSFGVGDTTMPTQSFKGVGR